MIFSRATPLALSTFAILTTPTTLAFPTKTQCRCTIVSDHPSQPSYTPSTAHWLPSSPSPSSTAADLCAALGPELETFQLTKPDLYDSYMRSSSQVPVGEGAQSIPSSTTVLLDFAGRQGVRRSSREEEGSDEMRATERTRQRIVCRAEAEAVSAYQTSFFGLWATQLVVVLAVFACVAEGLHLGLRWMERRSKDSNVRVSGHLRLQGGEKRLLAIPTSNTDPECIFSPGADKKLRAYESSRYVPVHWTRINREFSAYDEEDDDEMNRPVM